MSHLIKLCIAVMLGVFAGNALILLTEHLEKILL